MQPNTTCTRFSAPLGDLFGASPPNSLNDVRKKSTRDELRGRLARAKTVIDDTQGQFADLDDLAAVACLSKYYFLRLFADVYGLGAGAYARRKRIEAARDFLQRGGSLEMASQTSGYRDTRSFIRAYRRIIGGPVPGTQ